MGMLPAKVELVICRSVLAVLLVCAFMFAIYAIVRTEEHRILKRTAPDSTPRQS